MSPFALCGPGDGRSPSASGLYGSVLSPSIVEASTLDGRAFGEDDLEIQRPLRLAAAVAALFATAVLAAGLAACSAGGDADTPQGGVAPRGASGVDAGVTNGAITYSTRDLVALMADAPSQAERFNAATLAGQKMAGQPVPPAPRLDPDATPDYFGGVPNWANSPQIRKFVDELPGVGAAAANGLGQYIPVATPDTVTYPGSDYYEIAVREYTEQLHSDLPATRLRGYVQLNLGHGRERPQHRGPGADPLPRPAHPRPPRPAGARQVRQPAAPGQGGRPVPARGHDHQGRRRRRRWAATTCTRRTARRSACTAGSRPGSAAARSTSGSRRPAGAAPTGRARAWSTSPTCGSTGRADR